MCSNYKTLDPLNNDQIYFGVWRQRTTEPGRSYSNYLNLDSIACTPTISLGPLKGFYELLFFIFYFYLFKAPLVHGLHLVLQYSPIHITAELQYQTQSMNKYRALCKGKEEREAPHFFQTPENP